MRFFTAIFQLFATMFSPLRHPGERGGGGGGSGAGDHNHDDLDEADARARRKQILAVVAVLVIIGSLVSLYFTMVPSAPKINRQPFIGLGQVLAEETAKTLSDRGRVTLVIADYHQKGGTPMNDQYEHFRSTLKKHSGVEIAATEVVVPDETMATSGLTVQQFDDLLKKHSSVSALVIFVGLPGLDEQPTLQVPDRHPKLIAIQTSSSPAKPYFERGIAEVLILPRINLAETNTANPTTPRGWFDKYFEVFTTKNYQSIPE